MRLYSNLFTIITGLINFGSSTTTINYNTYCPEGYFLVPEFNNTCVLITPNSQYNQECLKSGSLSIYAYLEMIKYNNDEINLELTSRFINDVWLPIRINADDLLVWDMPGRLDGNGLISVDIMTSTTLNYDDGDCVVYNTLLQRIRMKNCDNSFPHVCFLNPTDPLIVYSTLCDNGYLGRLSKYQDLCFVIEDVSEKSWRETIIIDTHDIFAIVAQLIDLLNMTNDTILVDNKLESLPGDSISVFQNGSIINVDKNDVTKRLAVEHRSSIKKPSIVISYNASSTQLLVTITNYEFFWSVNNSVAFWCNGEIEFIENEYLNLDFVLINDFKNSKVFRTDLRSYNTEIRTVWCVGQMIITSKQIESNRILINGKYPDWDIVCAEVQLLKCTSKYISCQLKQLINIKKSVESTTTGFMWFLHIKKIVSLQDENRKFLLHFVVQFDKSENSKLRLINLTSTPFYKYESNYRLRDVCESTNTYFPNAKLNEFVLPNKLCYYDSKVPIQECIGNIMDGAYWKHVVDTTKLNCTAANETINTKPLFDMIKRFENFINQPSAHPHLVETIDEAILLLNKTISSANNTIEMELSSKTLYRLGQISQDNIFDLTSNNGTRATITPDIITNMSDGILNVQTESLIDNKITMLNTIDLLTTQFAESKAFQSSSDGVRIFQSRNVIFIFINPLVKNITGFELHRKTDHIESFLDFTVKTLDVNHRIENTKLETLELMAHIPAKTYNEIWIQRSDEIIPADRIIYKVYYQSSLFNETISSKKQIIIADSKMVGIKIPNYPSNQLYPDGGLVMLRPLSSSTGKNEKRGCSQNAIESNPTKEWSKDFVRGPKKDPNTMVICRIKRSANTGFAKLLGPTDFEHSSNLIEILLKYATNLGCTLSVIGLIIIFVTAITNREWKKREATPLLLNISVAAMFLIFVYYIENIFSTLAYRKYCNTLGGLLHLAVLVGFCISVLVTNCQYRRYVTVFGSSIPRHFKIKLLIFGWILPFAIVALCWGFSPDSYSTLELIQDGDGFDIQLKCFPKEGILYFGLHLPIIVIFLYNLCIYIWIIKRLLNEDPTLRKTPRKSKVFQQIRLFLFLFFVLSITWIFGLLHYYTEFSVFAFLFNLTAPLQGFCLCIFSVIVDQKTRQFWIRSCKCK